YALNPYAQKVELVPTVNFVLRWITGRTELHRYDESLTSIELVTADAYEPVLPLSLVLHIDYERASSVVQRFGDVKRLISQTLDPILTAYFRDVAQSSSMLDLLTKREEIQKHATAELGRRFKDYDINCVAVLIGRPESKQVAGKEDAIDRLFDQLRQRRLAEEQKETYAKQEEASIRLKQLNEANAAADKQKQLTETRIEIEVAANRGEAQLAEAQRMSKREIALAEGLSRAQELMGKGEASKIAQVGLSEASVSLEKIRAYGDPRLFALNLVAEHFAHSAQPLVPERLFVMGGESGQANDTPAVPNMVGQLLALLLSEKSGLGITARDANRVPAAKPPVTTPAQPAEV
ncbi:MAG TPA: SPFH domain-containing protein, partial [Chthoniobacterales bacterium]|nr:SPFH domain-containing protein [Chthoniobacterales bacterium]